MDTFLSCDWGSSVFRLRLSNLETAEVVAAENSNDGIFSTFTSWKETGNTGSENRFSFFMNFILQQVRTMESRLNMSLSGVPLVISGMASSSIGMKPLPYQELPFALDGSSILYDFSKAGVTNSHAVLLISGVKSENDVMRGEETQLIGCINDDTKAGGAQLYIFPGTHSKHIFVKDGLATAFRTYMTGELFALLSEHSILSATIEKNDGLHTGGSNRNFEQGIRDAVGSNLLHACFKVRTNSLFEKMSKKENYDYLSGLLIGSELQELLPAVSGQRGQPYDRIFLCCGSHLKTYYETALDILGLSPALFIFSAQSMDEAVVRGQRKILLKELNHD